MSEPLPPVERNDAAGRFEATVDGHTGYTEYRRTKQGLLLPHTLVPDALEGRGIGSALARAALGYAREEGLKVLPDCPFIAAYIQRHPETQDLVHPGYRQKLGL